MQIGQGVWLGVSVSVVAVRSMGGAEGVVVGAGWWWMKEDMLDEGEVGGGDNELSGDEGFEEVM